MMKTIKKSSLIVLLFVLGQTVLAQGWPYDYDGVMLQGFYWDSYKETSWAKLKAQADDIAPYFQLIWVPQSGWCNNEYSMGYTPVYYFNQKSAFGSERELRDLIAAYRERGTGLLADVVINHRNNLGNNGSWVDFPVETWNGQTYQMGSTDICQNDDGGQTANWAGKNGLSLSINNDTGDDFSGSRDLDHNNPNVQNIIKAYLKFLLEDMGYVGFRYDMVKGYYASFVADYNMAVKPTFSVGEYFDGTQKIKEWVNYSRGYVADYPTSAAFDFPFRFRMREAIESRNWRQLGWDDKPISTENYYKQYAVTFVENHDTEYRSSVEMQTPIWKDTLAANAYLLAMPGTPCVFYTHWRDCKYPIKQMILARKIAGITNTSGSEEKWTDDNFYAKATYGKKGTLLCVVGNNPNNYNVSSSEYKEILSGKGYRYLLSRSANTVWMDVPGGIYQAPLSVKLTAVSNLSGARIVYTTDGSMPTSNSPQLTSGAKLSIKSSCTLTAGILAGGKVQGIQQREYTIFEPYDITVYVSSDIAWGGMYFYAWDNLNKQLSGNWPGKHVTTNKNIDGKRWFYQTYHITTPESYINLIVSNSTGNRQTIDITGLRSETYLCITGTKDEDKYVVENQTKEFETGIGSTPELLPMGDFQTQSYNLQGLRVFPGNKKGIVIEKGRKVAY